MKLNKKILSLLLAGALIMDYKFAADDKEKYL